MLVHYSNQDLFILPASEWDFWLTFCTTMLCSPVCSCTHFSLRIPFLTAASRNLELAKDYPMFYTCLPIYQLPNQNIAPQETLFALPTGTDSSFTWTLLTLGFLSKPLTESTAIFSASLFSSTFRRTNNSECTLSWYLISIYQS